MMLHNRLRDLTEGIKLGIFFISGIKLLTTLTFILQALLMANLIDKIISFTEKTEILKLLFLMLCVLLIRALLVYFTQYLEKRYSSKIKTTLRKRCFEHIFLLGPAFLNNNRTGNIESTIVSGVEYLEAYLVKYIPQILVTIVGSGIIIVKIFKVNINMGFFVLIVMILALVGPKYWKKIIQKSSNEHWGAFKRLNSQFIDSIQGIVTLIAFNASEKRGETLENDSKDLYIKTMKNLRNSLVSTGIADIFMTLGTSVSVAIAAYMYSSGKLSSNSLLTLLFLTREAFRPIEDLKKFYHKGFNGISAADSLFELLDEKIPDRVTSIENDSYKTKYKLPKIEFKNVVFAYNKNEDNVLNGIDFTVNPGEKVAIVGESGSGKTTLINLLLGFYDNYDGEILINDVDINDLPLDKLRELFSLVAQDTYLFNESIIDNIRLANQNVDEKKIEEVIKIVNLDIFISELEEKIDTVLGERGSRISGGEKQRISIARAILKNAPILLLDEATSSLDNENENEIKENLKNIMEDRTTLIIAHRLSTIINADKILVLTEGKIVEKGTHEELLAKNGYYKKLFCQQIEA